MLTPYSLNAPLQTLQKSQGQIMIQIPIILNLHIYTVQLLKVTGLSNKGQRWLHPALKKSAPARPYGRSDSCFQKHTWILSRHRTKCPALLPSCTQVEERSPANLI